MAVRMAIHMVIASFVVAATLGAATPTRANPSGDDPPSDAVLSTSLLRPPVPESLRLTVPLDGRATYLRTDDGDSTGDPAIIDLTAAGLTPGVLLRLSYSGWFYFGGACTGTPTPLNDVGIFAVFSTSSALLPPSELHRVPGAIDAGPDYFTGPTFFSHLPQDIPEDFRVLPSSPDEQNPDGFEIETPAGARYLFIGIGDSWYQDNCGQMEVTVVNGTANGYGEIAGRVWYDRDGDRLQGALEPGLMGIGVNLRQEGVQIGTTITGDGGWYRFALLPRGKYIVAENQPGNLRFSSTPNEVTVRVEVSQTISVDFGDWNGLSMRFPLLSR